MVYGFLRMMDSPEDITGPTNLGNPIEMSIAELAELVIDLTGSRSRIVHRPLPVDEPIQCCPDISLASALLDWKPRTAVRSGLQRRIAYFGRLLSDIPEPSAENSTVAE